MVDKILDNLVVTLTLVSVKLARLTMTALPMHLIVEVICWMVVAMLVLLAPLEANVELTMVENLPTNLTAILFLILVSSSARLMMTASMTALLIVI
jgi:hypothetical protein